MPVNDRNGAAWAHALLNLAENILDARIDGARGDFETGTPQPLFRTHTIFFPPTQQYDVSCDGRFLIVTELEETPAEPIHILLNWKPPAR
jgi:hypothetical protein